MSKMILALHFLHSQLRKLPKCTEQITRMLFGCVLATFLCATPGNAQDVTAKGCGSFNNLPELRIQHLKMLNLLRRRQGLPVLTQETRLNAVAQNYACELARTGHFDHVGPTGSTLVTRAADERYDYCSLAENLAKGQRNFKEAMIGWVKSPGHWLNLINKNVTEVGFGAAFANLPVKRPSGVFSLSDLARKNAPSEAGTPAPAIKGPLVWVQFFGKPRNAC